MRPSLFIVNTISVMPRRGKVTAGSCPGDLRSEEIWLALALRHRSSRSSAAASAWLSSSEAGQPWKICDAGHELMQDVGRCRMQDMRYGMQDARRGTMQDAGYGMWDAGWLAWHALLALVAQGSC